MTLKLTRRSVLAGGVGALSIPSVGLSEPAKTAIGLWKPENGPLSGLIPEGSQANLAAIVHDWKQDTGIAVRLKIVPVDDMHLNLTMGALSGIEPPDFALPPTFSLPDLVDAEMIASHSDIAAATHEVMQPPEGLYQLGDHIDGHRVGMQTDGDVYLMFYRTDLRDRMAKRYEDAHGIALRQPETWPELDRQMAFFHRPDQGQFGGALFRTPGYIVWEFWARLHAKGALPFNRDLSPLIHEPPGIEALEQMIAASKHLHPATKTASLFENWRLFKTTDTYCNIGWGGSQKSFNAAQSPIRGRLSYGRLPGELCDHSSCFNWGWSYVVPSAARQPELGHLFAAYATSSLHSIPAIRAAGGYFDPFLPSHYEDPVVREIYSQPFLDIHRIALADCIPDLYLPGYGTLSSTLSHAIADALEGRVSPRQALTGASEAWQVELLNYNRDDMITRWRDLLSRYPSQFTQSI